jgi:hypothetical protein
MTLRDLLYYGFGLIWPNRGPASQPEGDITMTTDAFRAEFAPKTFDGVFTISNLRFASVLTFIGYAGVFVGYIIIFSISLLTVGFLEIRQANMGNFNALIAVLEQRDGYFEKDGRVKKAAMVALDTLKAQRADYQSLIDSFHCPQNTGSAAVPDNAQPAELAGSEAVSTKPKTCDEIKHTMQRHADELAETEADIQFKQLTLPFWYDQYKDGITRSSPQIIPTLRFLESDSTLLTLWARSPFELVEMFLLVVMGLLGGVISVMRCFVDPKLQSPVIAEFFYKPAAGAAISLGVYVLFRAAQIFLGVQSGPETVSTSVFLLAGLGLASGFCAGDALAQIEFVATRLLRRSSGRDQNGGESAGGSTPSRGDDANSGPAAVATSH